MKTALLISSIINILLALIAFISDITPIYPIALIILTLIYLKYQSEPITYLHNKRSTITIMAIINFFINPISGIIMLIGLDKLKEEYKNTKENIKELTKEEKQITLLLNLGVGLISLSGIILITTKWGLITPLLKIIILLLVATLFLVLSIISKQKLKIEILEKNYWLISMLFMILTVIANGYLNVTSNWFSLNGNGNYLYIAFISIIIALISEITDKKYPDNTYKNITYIGIITSILFIILQLNVPIEIALALLNIGLLILMYTLKKDITKILIIISAIISTIFILNSNELINIIILSLTTLINITTLALKGNIIEGIIAPLIITPIILKTTYKIEDITKIENIEEIILTIIYSVIYLLNLLKINNKVFKTIMNIITNLIFISLLIVSEENKILLTIISLFMVLTSIINYIKNTIKAEKILLPIKITILIISLILLMQEIINPLYSIIIIYTILFMIYLISKNKIKKISIILYYITFILSLTQNNELIPGIINILASITTLLIITKEKNKTHIRISYVILLLTLEMTLLHTNILQTTNIVNSILLLLIYMLLTLSTIKENTINKINYLAITLPLIELSQDINITYEIQSIIGASIALYIVLLINIFLIKKETDRNVLTTILTTLIILSTMFKESWVIGLYIGLIALILIIIGTLKKEYKGILIEGIIITIINIIYQFNYIIKELPLWIYTLLAGLTLIGLVTYKITKNEKK